MWRKTWKIQENCENADITFLSGEWHLLERKQHCLLNSHFLVTVLFLLFWAGRTLTKHTLKCRAILQNIVSFTTMLLAQYPSQNMDYDFGSCVIWFWSLCERLKPEKPFVKYCRVYHNRMRMTLLQYYILAKMNRTPGQPLFTVE